MNDASPPLKRLNGFLASLNNSNFRQRSLTFLRSLTNEPKLLENLLSPLAERAQFSQMRVTWHPLKFYTIILTDHNKKDMPSARFIWFDSTSPDIVDIHNHAYDVSALVTIGTVTEHFYVDDDRAGDLNKYFFDGHLKLLQESVGLRKIAELIGTLGCAYYLDHQQLHASRSCGAAGVLMIRSQYRRYSSEAYRHKGQGESAKFDELDHTDFLRLLDHILDNRGNNA